MLPLSELHTREVGKRRERVLTTVHMRLSCTAILRFGPWLGTGVFLARRHECVWLPFNHSSHPPPPLAASVQACHGRSHCRDCKHHPAMPD